MVHRVGPCGRTGRRLCAGHGTQHQFLPPEVHLVSVHVGLHALHLRQGLWLRQVQPDVCVQKVNGRALGLPLQRVGLHQLYLARCRLRQPLQHAATAKQLQHIPIPLHHGHALHRGLQRDVGRHPAHAQAHHDRVAPRMAAGQFLAFHFHRRQRHPGFPPARSALAHQHCRARGDTRAAVVTTVQPHPSALHLPRPHGPVGVLRHVPVRGKNGNPQRLRQCAGGGLWGKGKDGGGRGCRHGLILDGQVAY
ncbi:hypothetical protein D3C71_1218410 [compost metagenome]